MVGNAKRSAADGLPPPATRKRRLDAAAAPQTAEATADILVRQLLTEVTLALTISQEICLSSSVSGEELDAQIREILGGLPFAPAEDGRSTASSENEPGSDASLSSPRSTSVHIIVEKRLPEARRRGGRGPKRVPPPPSSPHSSSSTNSEKSKCLKCSTGETPQWRYIHTGRYCNACYMRVKRWVDNNLHGRKLPSRVKVDLSADEDARLTFEATEIVGLAFASLDNSKSVF